MPIWKAWDEVSEARLRLPVSLKTLAILCVTTPLLWVSELLLVLADVITSVNKVVIGSVNELLAMTDEWKQLSGK